MSKKITEPQIPDEILEKIEHLNNLLDIASGLYDEITDWYDMELKSYEPSANALDELFHPGTGIIVPYVSSAAMLDGLTILQTFNEVDVENQKYRKRKSLEK